MVKKIISIMFACITILLPFKASAILSMELTQGVVGAIPIAIVPFNTIGAQGEAPLISEIINNDLKNSGRFKVSIAKDGSISDLHNLGTNNVVKGQVIALGSDRYEVTFKLLDVYQTNNNNQVVLSKKYTISGREWRNLAHHISDLIYQQILGIKGIFSTKLAYVVVQRNLNGTQYRLEVADQDGYNPRPLLTSREPIMSPSWSPDGKQLAYVSFENRRSGIYLQDLSSGSRRLLSEFPGINGAPSWSQDGRKLALVLSKSGAPNIYVMDIASGRLTQVTNDFYINTEPAWSNDGRSLLFTSNRSGGHPQIYQINLTSKKIERVSFDGDYNARASFTQDGNHIAMIHRDNGIYHIAILDLDTGRMRILNESLSDSSSPSIAPNGSMVLYDTVLGGRNLLAMVSADGRIQLHLPARNGEAQDPAWSPFLS